MYVLTRYVVWEVLKIFLAAFGGIDADGHPRHGFNEGLKKGLPALVMLRTMPYMLPKCSASRFPSPCSTRSAAYSAE